jgi:hypothetical protein
MKGISVTEFQHHPNNVFSFFINEKYDGKYIMRYTAAVPLVLLMDGYKTRFHNLRYPLLQKMLYSQPTHLTIFMVQTRNHQTQITCLMLQQENG